MITNLRISKLAVWDDDDPEIKEYIHYRHLREVFIKQPEELKEISTLLDKIVEIPMKIVNGMQLFEDKKKKKFYFKRISDVTRGKIVQVLDEFNQNIEDYTIMIGFGKNIFTAKLKITLN